MTTTKVATAVPVVPGLSTEEQTYATRYKQGGRTVYGLALTPDQIINLIHRPDPEAMNPGNRKIRPKHAADFANYVLNNESWVAPGIILRAPSIFKFNFGEGASEDSAQLGVLSYPKRTQREIQILDGQHRILGFHLALDTVTNRIEKAKDFRSKALKVEQGDKNSAAFREAEKALKDAEALRDRLYTERVSVEIQVTDDVAEYRQLFYDIAENALGITAAVKARFDSRKVVNRALASVMEHPLLANRVDIDLDRISRTSPYFLSAKHVADLIRATTVGTEGRIGKIMERDLVDANVAKNALKFFDIAVEAFAPYRALIATQVMPEDVRKTSLLGSPGMMRILAGVYHDLKTDHGFDDAMVLDYFKTLAPHLAAPAHANSIWVNEMAPEVFTVDSFGPNLRRQDTYAGAKTLTEWAVLGKKGAPFVWAPPRDAPEPAPSEEEVELQGDIAADPELGKLLAAREELEEKMIKSGKVKR